MELKAWDVGLRKLSATAATSPSTPPPAPIHQVFISSMFYAQLLRQYIYDDLTGAWHRAISVKVGLNF